MISPELQSYFCPDEYGRLLLNGLEEIIGQRGILAVLSKARCPHLIESYCTDTLNQRIKFAEVSQIQLALEELYGIKSGRGLASRSGSACFKYGLRHYGVAMGITETSFRLLSLPAKLRYGAEKLTEALNQYTDQRVRLAETQDHLLWIVERCPFCWGRKSEEPLCYLVVGFLQEALYWISGGKYFCVEETECIAAGDKTCTFAIDKHPIE